MIEPLDLFPLYNWDLSGSTLPDNSTYEGFWIEGHQKRAEKWRRAAFEWSKRHCRYPMCYKQRCGPMIILTENEMSSKILRYDLLPRGASREDEGDHRTASSSSSSIPKRSAALQTLLTQPKYTKSGIYEEIRACGSLIVGQIQDPDHRARSTAEFTLAAFAVHGKFYLKLLPDS